MPVKLQLSFDKTAPKGDVTTICLIGKKGDIIPHLEQDVAAFLIAAMATAQFTGKAGKSLMIYNDKKSYLLLGAGDKLAPGKDAEIVGGKLFSALAGTA
ncbi:MAG: leucyl aminopeptidase, partial [Rhodobacteraceae bacterium]|nr:leucyl aminopeptidase [Paracoccaceae bacterium]